MKILYVRNTVRCDLLSNTFRFSRLVLLALMVTAVPASSRAGGCISSLFTPSVYYDLCTETFCLDFTIDATGLYGNDHYSFDFGDGSTFDTTVARNISLPQEPPLTGICHSYAKPGTYVITVNITPAHTNCIMQQVVTFGNTAGVSDVTCSGNGSDGNIDYNFGGQGTYTYLWSNGATTEDITGVPPGTYTVTITEVATGCTTTDTATVLDRGFRLDLTANCSDSTASVGIERDSLTFPPLTIFNETFDTNGLNNGCGANWVSTIYNPNNVNLNLFWWETNGLGEFEVNVYQGYGYLRTRCFDISGCSDVRVSFDAKYNGQYASQPHYLRFGYNLDGGGDVQLFGLGDAVDFPNHPNYSTFASPVPAGNCLVLYIEGHTVSSLEKYWFDNVLITCNGGADTIFYEDFTDYLKKEIVGNGGCWKILGGTRFWENFQVVNNAFLIEGMRGNEGAWQTVCFDLSGCGGQPTLYVDLAVKSNIQVEPDDYIRFYYSYNNGGEVLLFERSGSGGASGPWDLTEFDTLSKVIVPLPVGPGGCVTLTVRVKNNEANEGYYFDNLRIECPPKVAYNYTYLWCTGETTPTVTGLSSDTCRVTVTDNNGCSQQDLVDCNAIPPSVTLTADTICLSECTDLLAIRSNGSPPYSYTWNNGITGTTAGPHNVCPGATTTYNVTITDSNSKTAETSVVVVVNYPPSATPSGAGPLCYAACNGTAGVTVSGSAPFNYLWNDASSSTTASLSGLCAGSYLVTVTDSYGCTAVEQIDLTPPPALTGTMSKTDAPCNGSCSGSATASPSGGSPPYTYSWSNGATQGAGTLTGLCAGSYAVTVSDGNGCLLADSVTVAEPPALMLDTSATTSTCTSSDGSATVTASGGSGGYTYRWNDVSSSTTATVTGLGIGSYTVTVTDAGGCTETITAYIRAGGGFSVSTPKTDVPCYGDCTGSATAVPSSGTPPYTYQWNDPASQASATATGLCAGVYGVIVSDSAGCSGPWTVTIAGPPLLSATENHTDVICYGDSSGSVTVSVTGGTPPYTYLWNDGSTTFTLSGLAAAAYTVTIRDGNGCTDSLAIIVGSAAEITLSVSPVNASCGNADGSLSVTATGGSGGPFAYLWSDAASQTTATATGLDAGSYTVTVTDSAGCVRTITADIINSGVPVVAITGSSDASCYNGSDGNATASASSGNPPYSYRWSDAASQSTAAATGLRAGTYSVCVTDSAACTACTQVTIGRPSDLVRSLSATDENCNIADGTIAASASGGTPPYSYAWSDGQSGATATGLSAGTYSVTITDSNGCSKTASWTLLSRPGPVAEFDVSPPFVSIINPVVSFTDQSSGHSSGIYYFCDGSESADANPVHVFPDTGCCTVRLVVMSGDGCPDTTSRTVCVTDVATLYVPNAFTPNGDGLDDFFTIKGLNLCELKMYIFDRWGNDIYYTESLAGWDGTANSGSDIVQEDVYVWMIRAVDCYGKQVNRTGHVTVLK